MASIVNYAISARDSFGQRPLGRVDSLCLAWLSYFRLEEEPLTAGAEGATIAQLNQPSLRSRMASKLHNLTDSSMLMQAMAASPRFCDVRACWHVQDSSEAAGRQFAATSFVLPDSTGTYVAFRGTDDTLLGWKENVRLARGQAIPAQLSALAYLQEVATKTEGPLWVGGHSKGGALAAYAAGMADDAIRVRLSCCFSHDGPAVHPALRAQAAWHDDVAQDKTIPRLSLVGMLYERSQSGLTVVRSNEQGLMQHTPFSWEVRGNDFVCEQGMDYDAWRFSQRINDWLDDLDDGEAEAFAELLAFLMDATGEVSASGLMARWSSNAQVMQTALDAAPPENRVLLERVMEDLVTTVALGSRQEYAPVGESPRERADAAQRRMEDLTARANDHFARLDRLTGGA